MTLVDVIKSYRVKNRVSMEYVAKLCGITKGYVAMLEKNVNSKTGRPVKPTIETIVKVCNGLHLDLNAVFDSLDDDYEIALSPSSSSAPSSLQLTEQEKWLIDTYRKLDDPQRERLLAYIEGLLDAGSLKKHLYESPVVNEFMNYYDSPSGLMVAEPISEYTSESRIKKDAYGPVTIAAHHDSDEWSEDELKEIEDIKKYAKSKKK